MKFFTRNSKHKTTLALVLTGALGASAVQAQSVSINGKSLQTSVSPISRQGRTLVPMRAIFEGLGAGVNWNGATKTITSKVGGTTVTMQLGNRRARVNGNAVTLEQAPMLYRGQTMVPLRFVSEALGAKVNYNAASRSIAIATAGGATMGGGTTQRAGTEGTTGQWLSDAPTMLRVDGLGQASQYGKNFVAVNAMVRNSDTSARPRNLSVKDAALVLNDGTQVKYQATLKDWQNDGNRGMKPGATTPLTLHFPADRATGDVNRVVITLFSNNGYGAGNHTSVFRASFPGAQASMGDTSRRDGTSGNRGELLVTPEIAVRLDRLEKVNRYGNEFIMATGIVRNTSPQKRNYNIPSTAAATLVLANGETVQSSLQASEIGDSSRQDLQRGEETALKLWFPTRNLNDKNPALDGASIKVTINHALSGKAPQTKTFNVTF